MRGRSWKVLRITLAMLAMPLAAAHAADERAVSDSTTSAPAASVAQPDTAPREGEPRTLEDINIEGKIAVPQVLFITARDPRRFLGFQHRGYLKTCTMIGDETPYPSWIARFAQPTTPATKETSP